jgi:acyl carrier protein
VNIWKKTLFWIVDRTIRCRYSIDVRGLKELRKSQFHNEGGILFLPNHPAEIDPILLNLLTQKQFKPRPLVVENFFYLPGATYFMKVVNALPIPNIESIGNKWKMKKVDRALESVIRGLEKGENFTIYPSGGLKKKGREEIGGNSFVHNLLQKRPNTKIVLVRTTGLWGSTFSRAITGRVPDFWKVCLRGLRVFFRHIFIFTPKRKITVEFLPAPAAFPFRGTRLELNHYLEEWYNNYPSPDGGRVLEEPLHLVSYKRNKEEYVKPISSSKMRRRKRAIDLSEDDKTEICEKIAEMAEVSPSEVTEDVELASDLGLDSLDVAEIHAYIDHKFDIGEVDLSEFNTVYNVFEAAHGHAKSKNLRRDPAKGDGWPKEDKRKGLEVPEAVTIPEAFLHTCKRMGGKAACADHNTAAVSYKRMKIGVIALAEQIRKMPGKYVGILLPSSSATYIIILATLMARKVPAMLNWTVGVRSLNHAKDLLNLKAVISSRRFLNKVDSLDLGDIEDVLILAEDMKKKVRLPQKIHAALTSKRSVKGILRKFGLRDVTENDTSVVLFTSGTESYPKAVPLTHRNILENQRGALSCVSFSGMDVMYGVLPPFHSFGFSVTGLFPILCGMRVFYSPDPTDVRSMAEEVYDWKATIFCCAPTFYRNLFRVAARAQLKSIRVFVTGAEKAGEDLFNSVQSLGSGAEMIEGYGITECAPMVTLCRPGEKPAGVGKPIPGIDLCLVDPDTRKPSPNDKIGEVCIRGPNVFHGYLGHSAPDAFIELDGEKWYLSGDLGTIDNEGNLILGGRLKRFVKIGGEMVSLVALEEELLKVAKAKNWEPLPVEFPSLVVMPIEREKDRPQLILFCTFSTTKEEINKSLNEVGFGRIVKISDVRQIDAIPLTGTSKVHYRKLNEML